MYEPIRTKSVHTAAESTRSGLPRRTREEELDIRLAGHLTALLTVTDELRVLTPSPPALDTAAAQLAAHAARLSGGRAPLRAAPSAARAPRPVMWPPCTPGPAPWRGTPSPSPPPAATRKSPHW